MMSQSILYNVTGGLEITNTRHIDLILVGKTGNGKSSIGNSIIGRKKFKFASATDSVTQNVQYEVTRYKSCTIKVMDTPGMADTSAISDPIAASKTIMKQMQNAVILNPEGYHAFLLVFKYGARYTNEEHESVKMLRHIFGPNFIKTFCILVLSQGDIFEKDHQDDKQECFKRWLAEQKYEFQELIQECQNRVVLFDNKYVDENVRENQLNELLEYVDHLNTGKNRYSDVHFKQAERSRKELLDETLVKLIRDELMELELISQSIDVLVEYSLKNNISLEKILADCEKLFKKNIKNYHDHEIHREFQHLVISIHDSIRQFLNRMGYLENQSTKVDDKLKEESKRLADLLYRYASVQGIGANSITSSLKTDGNAQQVKIDPKNDVISEFSRELTIEAIVDEFDSLEAQMKKFKVDLEKEKQTFDKRYAALKGKCSTMLTKNNRCFIS